MEEKQVKEYEFDYIMSVEFPTSNKRYDYIINQALLRRLQLGLSYSLNQGSFYILSEKDYIYTSPVKICELRPRKEYDNLTRIIGIIPSQAEEYINEKTLFLDANYFDFWSIEEEENGIKKIIERFKKVKADYERNTLPKEQDKIYLSTSNQKFTLGAVATAFKSNLCDCTGTVSTINDLKERISSLEDTVREKENSNIKTKGEKGMKLFDGFEFGKIKNKGNYAMTLKGLAYANFSSSGEQSQRTYVQYNPEKGVLEDVSLFILNDFEPTNFLYKVPVALKDIEAGDIILNNGDPVFVKSVAKGAVEVVCPLAGTIKSILPKQNALGYSFVTKVVNLLDGMGLFSSADENNPFGNMLPMLMFSDGNFANSNDMLPLLLMSNGGMDFSKNPMLMYFLMKDGFGSDNELLPFLMMSNPNMFNFMPAAAEKGDE
jgi:hypothetical protein